MFNLLFQTSAWAGAKSLICAVMLGATSLTAEPTEPHKPTTFDAKAYVTSENKIYLAVEKMVATPVTVTLRAQGKDALFTRTLSKKQMKFAARFDVSDLTDGTYELEIKSDEGTIVKQLNLVTPNAKPARTIAMQ